MADLSHFGYIMNENMDDEMQWSRYIVRGQLVVTGGFIDPVADGLVSTEQSSTHRIRATFRARTQNWFLHGSMSSPHRVQRSFPFYDRSSLVIRPPRSPLDATATTIMVGHKARMVLTKAVFGYDELLSNAEAMCGRGI